MITVVDSPYQLTQVKQKLQFVLTSDNSGESGFRIKFTIVIHTDADDTTSSFAYINPSGSAIINAFQFFRLMHKEVFTSTSVHAVLSLTNEPYGFGFVSYDVDVEEYWIVGGVLTLGEDLDPISESFYTWNAVCQWSEGYKPDPATRYALNGITDRWLSDRQWNTHKPSAKFPLSQATNKVFIPVRETDYGVLSMIRGITGDTATKVGVTIFDSAGAPHAWLITIGTTAAMIHLPLFPANLNATTETGWLHPSDYPGWKYIQIRAEKTDTTVVSVNYILYNMDVYGPCEKHDAVRVAWVGSGGGWDYFNFTRKNEVSNNIDKKRYRAVIGNYGEVFSMTGMERGLTELDPIVEQSITVNSSPISENEFVFLRGLMVSKQVMIVNDNGTHTPVVVDTKTWTEIRDRKSTLKYAQVVLQYSQDYNA